MEIKTENVSKKYNSCP